MRTGLSPVGQGRKVNIDLGEVLDVAAIISGELFWGVRIIVNVTLVCKHLKESDASRS
jgi:hypothetical protein